MNQNGKFSGLWTSLDPARADSVSIMTIGRLALDFVGVMRACLLAGAAAWSLWLSWLVCRHYGASLPRRIASVAAVACAVMVGTVNWIALFWIW